MKEYKKHFIYKDSTVREALVQLDTLASDAILFITNKENKLLGSLTDGDLRRGFIKGLGFENAILDFVQESPKFILEDEFNQEKLENFKNNHFKIIPILNTDHQIVDVLNFKYRSTLLPLDAVLMAGGKGMRLRPLTENTPKPLLKVGDKPIIEYNIDRLAQVGVENIHLSINYLGDQLEAYFGDGTSKNINIGYVKEDKPMGTIGSVLLVNEFKHDEIIVMNSDLLTNIDFADFYKTFKESGADMAVAATTYQVNVPYAVLETDNQQFVKTLKEKPKYRYYSNAGIYILKKSLLDMIPKGEFYDITDLMEKVLAMDNKLITYPINGYWLDIGKHEDFAKAQEDIKHIKL
ncbi:nucleotidyltransferase family protein [Tamlana sp. 2_MG-2023]|uniref:nucleotidyltransferase family protein n=1 Tax=unclassified Tamlana TaxID=2614803 RepID=UPI0026E38381|nr:MULTISPECIES: nucleotidyltransferase family protein [unclassified Tamlana]MDO6759746.1 nucleotidyltransferase family protein [Tamlana sp. 2_MG-2023]MDO6791369.1 nucleotidyltransferase family protein [Tamlana sp. 1_MG-2023]